MSRDKTLEQRFESVLHSFGVRDSGMIAESLMDELGEYEFEQAVEIGKQLRRMACVPKGAGWEGID